MRRHISKRRIMLYDVADSLQRLGYSPTNFSRSCTRASMYAIIQLLIYRICQHTGLKKEQVQNHVRYTYSQFLKGIFSKRVLIKKPTLRALLTGDTDNSFLCPVCHANIFEAFKQEFVSGGFNEQKDFYAGVPEDRRPTAPTKSPTKQ